jgi:alpha-L-fucosidase
LIINVKKYNKLIMYKSLSLILLLMIVPLSKGDPLANQMPKTGVVPNAATALKIAEAIWLPIYGKDILNQKPFQATLNKEGTIWTVQGTQKQPSPGGTAYIEIQKSDCKILKVTHGA